MTMQKDMERRRPAGAQSMGIHYMSMVQKKLIIACLNFPQFPPTH